MPETKIVKIKNRRHYCSPPFCTLLDSFDIGVGDGPNGETVYFAWGPVLTREQVDHFFWAVEYSLNGKPAYTPLVPSYMAEHIANTPKYHVDGPVY